jgi:hypothetical protein
VVILQRLFYGGQLMLDPLSLMDYLREPTPEIWIRVEGEIDEDGAKETYRGGSKK